MKRVQSLIAVATATVVASAVAREEPVDYVRHVRPILSAKCFFCHGPDEATREAGLRLDEEQAAYEDRGGYSAVVPGDPQASEVVLRIEETEPSMQMPPPDSGKSLSPDEIDVLRRWIEQGGEYRPHWAFEPVRRPGPPDGAAAHPIDRFIGRRLTEQGLEPAPPADPHTMVRRVYLDLIGLPPSPEEADRFAANPTDEAYGELVDRLLASPHYGERWARKWLDLARYSDTKGYEKDRPREMWRYRDWVIDAINADMPFDQFTVEQVAGDMLPAPSTAQLVATGFHRNTMTNEEGGIDPQEFRFLSVVDRVNTTGTTWLGLTIGCAQCHTHKYDPITHKDYYAFFALLNNSDEPTLALPSAEADRREAAVGSEIRALSDSLAERYAAKAATGEAPPLEDAASQWAEEIRGLLADWTPIRPEQVETNLPSTEVLPDASVLVSGDVTNADRYDVKLDPATPAVTAIRIEAIPDESLPGGGSGRRTITENDGAGLGGFLLTEVEAVAHGPEGDRSIGFAAATATFTPPGLEPAMAIDGRADTGWTVHGRQRERQSLVLRFAKPVELSPGEQLKLTLRHDSFYPAGLGRFRLSLTDSELPVEATGFDEPTAKAIRTPETERDDTQRGLVRAAFLKRTPVLQAEHDELAALRNQMIERPTALVMRERTEHPRETHRRHRGEYLKRREQVEPDTPSVLPPLPGDGPADRLDLARWLVNDANPLTPRVVVNRYWQAFFGRGLVKTSEDFGLQGEFPSHPDLLDWLADEFRSNGWSRKALHKLIVTSDAYRRSAAHPAAADVDPENRWLARASRIRLDAESVRDVVLESSGLLSPKLGGPSVFPPQPPGVTEAAYGPLDWVVSTGEDRYRRGLYTFNKRTAPYAAFSLFDAPSGESCVPRRDRSNTPLQSLAMLNDEVVVEAARAMAIGLVQNDSAPRERAVAAIRRCVTRPPEPQEVASVLRFVEQQRERLESGQLDALRVLNAGPSIQWTFDNGAQGWTARNDARLVPADGRLVVDATGPDPFVGVDVEAPAGRYTLEFDARLAEAGSIELYWTTLDEPTESPERRADAKAPADRWGAYHLEFATNGPLRTLRLDLGAGPGAAQLDSVRLAYGDGLVSLTAGDDPVELAAWMLACRALLNLDEVVTRP
ncbi:PSD1 and planctomycete cytochrome C domain-containing protein [Botrimarina sp.]|uniref:PSD1 and planctomycete cytochrome C domain-containing protein n=1 Tax=Botrimarina sp. TaxID=2795802 RepID=UPI0032EFB849